ncbi:MAG: ATP-dependent RNA helicase RhlE [Microgenomates group bacterium GW2011_GWC1_39_7]|nr:MAG: ATP-dependent RNA helicase RhlE [Microgenomates group bacterium GW2011_GWC1_39_7]
MYNSKQRNHSHQRNGNNFYGVRPQSQRRNIPARGGFRHLGKKLDPNLFIKKAKETNAYLEHISSVKFSDYNIVDKLKRNIEEHGYSVPTAIQEKAIPQILAGRDIIGIANTGTGKTAAFLISLINKSYLDRNQRVLIVVPTRELAVML